MSNKYEQVETGIYKYVASDDETITYHERPWVSGRVTGVWPVSQVQSGLCTPPDVEAF